MPIMTEGKSTVVCPAFCDVHVHFREPGRPDKETILTGSRAAAAGGYTTVCPMPNLTPAPDCPENLEKELELIRRDAVVEVLPYATMTLGRKGLEPVDFHALKGSVVAFSDDGSGIQDDSLMRRIMTAAKEENCIIAAHCEDTRFGTAPEGEWRQIERDLRLAEETGVAYHVCHISTAQSVRLIREAKARGVDVSCETAPHYLLLHEGLARDEGRFKMNPPLRTPADRDAILEGLLDGTIDMIATDHAPHTAAEKDCPFAQSVFGIVGLETAFPLLYTHLVKPGIITLEKLVRLMSEAPRRRFGIPIREGDYCVWDLSEQFVIDGASFKSKGHSTPFDGCVAYGKCLQTVLDGRTVYSHSMVAGGLGEQS